MKKYKSHTLKEYLDQLSMKTPVPGGGSAAAMTGAMGASLLSMVAVYSLGKTQSKRIEARMKKIEKSAKILKEKFLDLVDKDAEAYLKVVKSRGKTKKEILMSLKFAEKVPKEICNLCYKGVQLSPDLVRSGNQHLICDVEIAVELLWSSFYSALKLVKQS